MLGKSHLLKLTLGLSLLMGTAQAEDFDREQAKILSKSVKQSLETAAEKAFTVSQRAQSNGNVQKAKKLERLGIVLANLGLKFVQKVVRPIRQGEEQLQIFDNLEGLQPNVVRFINIEGRLAAMPPVLKQKIQQVKAGLIAMELQLLPIFSKSLHCGSSQGRYKECSVGGQISQLQLTRRASRSPCRLNSSYGVKGNKIWVHRGCRADFSVVYQLGEGQLKPLLLGVQTKTMHCASSRGRPNKCQVGGTILDLKMVKKVSRSSCRLNHSYGSSGTAIWVKYGCRADFKVTYQ